MAARFLIEGIILGTSRSQTGTRYEGNPVIIYLNLVNNLNLGCMAIKVCVSNMDQAARLHLGSKSVQLLSLSSFCTVF